MDQWNGQYRPAPQTEQQQIAKIPSEVVQEPPDLEAMALTLDQMKIEAAIDSERTRAGLNGLFAFVLIGGVAFIGQYVVQYGAQSLQKLSDRSTLLDMQLIFQAAAAGLVVAIVVAVLSFLATRRTQRAVRTYEQHLIALGGTPLPERGQRFDKQR